MNIASVSFSYDVTTQSLLASCVEAGYTFPDGTNQITIDCNCSFTEEIWLEKLSNVSSCSGTCTG